MKRLLKRAEFQAVARGARSARRGFVLQAARAEAADAAARCGFTVTKKTGNAVVRNRIRRRLREAVRLIGALHGRPGTDYVVVGREDALRQDFAAVIKDLAGAFRQVHARLDGPGERRPGAATDRRGSSTADRPAESDDTSTGRTE